MNELPILNYGDVSVYPPCWYSRNWRVWASRNGDWIKIAVCGNREHAEVIADWEQNIIDLIHQ